VSGGKYVHNVHMASRKTRSMPTEDEGDNYVEGFRGLKAIGYQDFVSFECGCKGDRAKVLADAARLQQILMNLCANAAHAMREKGGVLDVTAREYEAGCGPLASLPDLKAGPYLMIEVNDTGHGMSEAVMERIFDPFFTTKRQGEGTGMGLAMVYGIVQNHGGSIRARSRSGARPVSTR